jgi:hypothetical protein
VIFGGYFIAERCSVAVLLGEVLDNETGQHETKDGSGVGEGAIDLGLG